MNRLQRCVPNSFPLPHEVFELGLSHGPLLVYISLVYHESSRHSADALSCAAISKLVGLCGKTVWTHLRTLESEGLIQTANSGGKFTCTLCPIQDKVEKRRAADPTQKRKISWRSTQQKWLTGEMFKAVFHLPNDVFRLSLKSGNLLYTLKPIEQVFREREKAQLDKLKQAEAQCKWDEKVRRMAGAQTLKMDTNSTSQT